MVDHITDRLDRAPVAAKLDLDAHATIPGKDGAYIDVDGTLARVEALASAGYTNTVDSAPLVTVAVPPRVSTAFVDSLDVSAVVSEFETHFSRGGEQARRGRNIDVAAGKLDGLILSPGQLVSFNEVVGDRSEANGFQKSWEIFKGEMVEGVARLKARKPELVDSAVAGVGALVDNAVLAVETGDHVGLGKLMDLNQMILAGLMLSTEPIEALCALARGAGALGAKLTGAGGGGSVIALVDGEAAAAPVLAAWSAAGYSGF